MGLVDESPGPYGLGIRRTYGFFSLAESELDTRVVVDVSPEPGSPPSGSLFRVFSLHCRNQSLVNRIPSLITLPTLTGNVFQSIHSSSPSGRYLPLPIPFPSSRPIFPAPTGPLLAVLDNSSSNRSSCPFKLCCIESRSSTVYMLYRSGAESSCPTDVVQYDMLFNVAPRRLPFN